MDKSIAASLPQSISPPTSAPRRPDFTGMIDELDLSGFQKEILKNRWLDQTLWFANKSTHAKRRMTQLRVILIVGGILLPTLAALPDSLPAWLNQWSIIVVSFIVAATAGLEGFFKYGDLYTQYRESAELMKIEGWSYFALSGQYGRFDTHYAAFEKFTRRIEDIIRMDVRAVLSSEEGEKGKGTAETGDRRNPAGS
jgi:hypothetical protein